MEEEEDEQEQKSHRPRPHPLNPVSVVRAVTPLLCHALRLFSAPSLKFCIAVPVWCHCEVHATETIASDAV
ncbi:hypothetical protein RJT34_12933 [Clitoria ternatea]|uniref:Uncharacterized protein n=1 Tax=Clitoria ternatea TaxID=43366 RepID=A0AAN9JPS0_CLITE